MNTRREDETPEQFRARMARRAMTDAALYACLFIALGWKIALAVFLLHWFVNCNAEGIALRWRSFHEHYRIARRYCTRRRAAWIGWVFVRASVKAARRVDAGEAFHG